MPSVLALASYSVLFLLSSPHGGQSFLTWPDCGSGNDDLMDCPVPTCPDCDLVDCLPELTPEQCPVGTFFRENMVFGGCCPACVTYLARGMYVRCLSNHLF